MPPRAWIRMPDSSGKPAWGVFEHPAGEAAAYAVHEIPGVLDALENAVGQGLHAVGFLAYEAAPAFDPAFVVHPSCPTPLAWFAWFDAPRFVDALPESSPQAVVPGPWQMHTSRAAYGRSIAAIKNYIAAGDTYQVNLTERLRADFEGDPFALFVSLFRAQPTEYAAYIECGDLALCSASPELFFQLDGERIACRPMKGTASRGLWPEQDDAQRNMLAASEKDRAENAMIVDMIRNDLGRIAVPGSVRVDSAFDIETYATVLQMTSRVSARTAAPVSEILGALFPCASITGAPKVRTMQIIRALEPEPRGVYTGCIGWMGPGRRASFNVAIRTVHVDRARGRAVYGTGGGIVWDSDADAEYAECRLKTESLTRRRPPFALLETLLWKRGRFLLLDEHLARLGASANYFDYPFDPEAVRQKLASTAKAFGGGGAAPARRRVRLLLEADGTARVEDAPLERARPKPVWRAALAPNAVESGDVFLYHKTTRRAVYAAARERFPGVDDVLLMNERGEVTESTIANLVVRRGGAWLTPPVSSGLLAGTLRTRLLARGRLREAVIRPEDLAAAEALYLINSVRGWMRVALEESPERAGP